MTMVTHTVATLLGRPYYHPFHSRTLLQDGPICSSAQAPYCQRILSDIFHPGTGGLHPICRGPGQTLLTHLRKRPACCFSSPPKVTPAGPSAGPAWLLLTTPARSYDCPPETCLWRLPAESMLPFPISKVLNPVAARLKFPRVLGIHPNFHISCLKPVLACTLVGVGDGALNLVCWGSIDLIVQIALGWVCRSHPAIFFEYFPGFEIVCSCFPTLCSARCMSFAWTFFGFLPFALPCVYLLLCFTSYCVSMLLDFSVCILLFTGFLFLTLHI